MTGLTHDIEEQTLDRLFFPRRVAIAGLSSRPRSWGRMAYQNLREAGFDGEVVAYRPRQPDPEVPAVMDLADGTPADVVVVAVPSAGAVDVVGEAAAAGVGAAVVFSAGFAEDGPEGAQLQERLVRAAGSMPVLGPNCLGVVSGPASLVLSVSGFLNRSRRPGPVALVSQSGAMGFILAEQLRRRGVGFSYYASTGNEAVMGAADLLSYVCARPEVKVVGCYLEGLRDVPAWRAACRKARDGGRHVIALKVGSTEAAQRAALSHTASAAGEAEMFEAAAREDGVTLVGDEVSFAEAVTALSHPVTLEDRPRLAVITMSGGGGAMIADQLGPVADVPPLAESTRSQLRSLDISLAGDGNPVDLTGMFSAHIDRLDDVITAATGDEGIDGAVLYFTFGDQMIDTYRSLAASLPDRPAPTWFVWAGAPEGEVEAQASTGRVVGSIPALVRSISAHPRRLPIDDGLVDAQRSSTGKLPSLAPGGVLTEAAVAPFLAASGLGYVPMAVAADRSGLLGEVSRMGLRPPYVLKVDHPDAPHRARLGLLSVGVAELSDLASEADRLVSQAARLGLDGARLVAEPMLSSVGSFSLGALRHADYGPVALVGPGGDRVEDSRLSRAAAVLPLSDRGLTALASQAAALSGRPITASALAGPLLALEALLGSDPTISEVDINPVLVTSDGGLVAVDALAVRAGTAPPFSAGSPQ